MVLTHGMKAFIAFVILLFLAIGVGGGFWAWGKWTKMEDWGLALDLGQPVEESEREMMEKRYNLVLDDNAMLEKTVTEHNLQDYYGVSSKEEAVAKLKEDTFVSIKKERVLHVLFRGERRTRDKREAAVRTLSVDFLKQLRAMSGS